MRQARLGAGLTQGTLAERAGIRRQTVTLVETGARQPSLSTLVELLAAAGMQMRVELEPLDADVRRTIEARRASIEPSADVIDRWWALTAFLDLAAVDYRVEGLAAAALLGAPVPVPAVQLALADTPATFRWLAEQLFLGLLKVRVDDRWEALQFSLPNRWAGVVLDDQLRASSAAHVERRLDEECPDGRFRLEGAFDEASVRLAPADEVARRVVVATHDGPIAVQPLDEIESADPRAAQVLRVMRSA